MKSKINVTQLLRHLIQAAAFVFFPGLFLSAFTALRDVIAALVAGSFSFAGLAGQLVLLAVMFLLTALWGRFFCGWLCAFGAMQELVGWVSKKLLPRLRAVPSHLDRILKYLKYAVLALIVVLVWIVQLPVDSTLSPWGVFGMLTSGNLAVMGAAIPTLGFAILVAILVGSFFVERFFCRWLCPLGALFTLASGHRLFRIRRKEEPCSGCGLCSRACAMGVSVHDQRTVRSGECIDCMRCVGVCQRAALVSNPHPAVAGTAAALMMCGLVSVGSIAADQFSETTETVSYTSSLLKSVVIPEEAPGQYADGVYTGSGNGFRGEVQVQVSVDNGAITDITVLSYKDDSQYFNKAKSGVITAILSQQTPEVDAISGATFSSRGIMAAVADALDVEYSGVSAAGSEGAFGQGIPGSGSEGFGMPSENGRHKKGMFGGASGSGRGMRESEGNGSLPESKTETPSALPNDSASSDEAFPAAAAGSYTDGVYIGSGTGLRGTTQVQVTVEDGMITDITVLSYADDRQYFTRAQSTVIASILKTQGIDVSTVSGATFSSNSILEAVADALDLDFTNPNASASGMGHGRHASV